MRPKFALAALVLAAIPGPGTFADDLFPPSYGKSATTAPAPASSPAAPSSRGKLGRWFKPSPPEVPPGPPRRPPAEPVPPPASSIRPPADAPIRRTQATPSDMALPTVPGAASPSAEAAIGGADTRSLSLQQALTGALTGNPDLVALRSGNPSTASAEAVEVARRFPTALNPTVFIDYRPITLIPNGTFGNNGTAGSGSGSAATGGHGSFYHNGQGYLLVAVRQPVEFGHQTTHRHGIAKAAYSQLQWQIVQAELTALVQTYRLFQTAAYRRERLAVAERLADFNDDLLRTLERRAQGSQVTTQPADVSLQKVESRATRQAARAAKQDYVSALADLRNQIGAPADSAAALEPLGEFTLPGNIPLIDEQAMIDAALRCRPDLHAAQAGIEAAASAVRLARGDRIPTAIIGPQYVQDEAGIQYVGLNFVPTLPILNNGKPLVRQREAEQRRAVIAYQQAQHRAVAQVRAAVAKWNGATGLVNDSSELTRDLGEEVARLERLFEANQTDLARLTQARQRLIQLENSRLDALWAATQAQSDLMSALGVPSLIHSLLQTAEADAGIAPAPSPAPAPPMAPTPSPFTPRPAG